MVSELVRRLDPKHRSLGKLMQEEFFDYLGIEVSNHSLFLRLLLLLLLCFVLLLSFLTFFFVCVCVCVLLCFVDMFSRCAHLVVFRLCQLHKRGRNSTSVGLECRLQSAQVCGRVVLELPWVQRYHDSARTWGSIHCRRKSVKLWKVLAHKVRWRGVAWEWLMSLFFFPPSPPLFNYFFLAFFFFVGGRQQLQRY